MAGEAWAMAEEDLGAIIEGDFGVPVFLIDPDGKRITTNAHDGSPLTGFVRYDYRKESAGEVIVVKEPVVILRKSSLARVPQPGEKWVVTFPKGPADPTPVILAVDPTDSMGVIDSMGLVKLFPKMAAQS